MRIQRTFFSYEARTNDNVKLVLIGTVFWQVKNVSAMVLRTGDPAGDVWHHSRSSFIQSMSNTSFDNFMGGFNQLAKSAFQREVGDGFYADRGVELQSMEVTRFEAVENETKATLRSINEETINQITLLKKQEGENAVKLAKMRAEMLIEKESAQSELMLEELKTNLIRTRADNGLIQKKIDAEAAAQPYAQLAKTFVAALNETGVPVASGLKLYQTLQEAEHHNVDTQNLAQGKATLFLTSSDVKLNIRELSLGEGNRSENGKHYHDL